MSTAVDYQPVSVGNRIVAALIDVCVLLVPIIILYAVLRTIDERLAGLAGIIVTIAYEVYMYTKSGKTIGKGVVKAQVTSDPATMALPTTQQAAVRSVARSGAPIQLVVAFAPALGFLSLLWGLVIIITTLSDSKKRGLHDRLAGTYIVSTAGGAVSASGTYVPPTDSGPQSPPPPFS